MELPKESYRTIFEKEEGHWWFRGRRMILATLLSGMCLPPDSRILDVGCGTGGNLVFLESYGRVEGCDASEEAIRFCHQRGFNEAFQSSIYELPEQDATYDLVTSFDVIEHLRLDLPAFQELARVTRPGGHVLVTLPASRGLYSSFDCIAGHLRRYLNGEVEELLRRSGLEPVRVSRYCSLMHPVTLYYRWLGTLVGGPSRHSDGMEPRFQGTHELMVALFKIEDRLLRRWDLPFGSSLFALARKPA
ncbi:MAG: class I SAM-dependent methyltransferase [Candidatus Geothermincolia bacterium]